MLSSMGGLACWAPCGGLASFPSASTSDSQAASHSGQPEYFSPHSLKSIFTQQSSVDPRDFFSHAFLPKDLHPIWPWHGADFSRSGILTAWLTCSWRPLLLSKWLFCASFVDRLENANVSPFYFIVLIWQEMLVLQKVHLEINMMVNPGYFGFRKKDKRRECHSPAHQSTLSVFSRTRVEVQFSMCVHLCACLRA